MLNFIELCDFRNVDPTSGRAVWAGRTGTRTALKRDGFMIGPKATAYRPREWLDEGGYLDAELARRCPRQWGI
jgi:hypothetical protein